MLETELTVGFYRENGGWVPELTDGFLDAYYGGLLSYREDYLEAMEGA